MSRCIYNLDVDLYIYIYIYIHIYIYIYKSLELLGELEELGGERRESSELGPGSFR